MRLLRQGPCADSRGRAPRYQRPFVPCSESGRPLCKGLEMWLFDGRVHPILCLHVWRAASYHIDSIARGVVCLSSRRNATCKGASGRIALGRQSACSRRAAYWDVVERGGAAARTSGRSSCAARYAGEQAHTSMLENCESRSSSHACVRILRYIPSRPPKTSNVSGRFVHRGRFAHPLGRRMRRYRSIPLLCVVWPSSRLDSPIVLLATHVYI